MKIKTTLAMLSLAAMTTLTGCGNNNATQEDITSFWNTHPCQHGYQMQVATNLHLDNLKERLSTCEVARDRFTNPTPVMFSQKSPLIDEEFTGDQNVINHAKTMEEAVKYGQAHLKIHHVTKEELQQRMQKAYDDAEAENKQVEDALTFTAMRKIAINVAAEKSCYTHKMMDELDGYIVHYQKLPTRTVLYTHADGTVDYTGDLWKLYAATKYSLGDYSTPCEG